jgi:hypothetical protein
MGSESREAENLNSDITEQAAQHTLAANPLVGVRGHDILASAGVLVGQMIKNPGVRLSAQGLRGLLGVLLGEAGVEVIAPAASQW